MAKTPINSALAVQKQAGRERRPLPGGRAGARAEEAAAPEETCPGGINPIPAHGRGRHLRNQHQSFGPNARELQLYSLLGCISSSFSL